MKPLSRQPLPRFARYVAIAFALPVASSLLAQTFPAITTQPTNQTVPVVTRISAGLYHSVALGTVSAWAWGSNSNGQLGDGTTTNRLSPIMSRGTGTAAGSYHTVGAMYCWGANSYGQLGNGSTTDSSTPVNTYIGGNSLPVAAGAYHSIAVAGPNQVMAWGNNSNGQLGNGTTTNSSTPVQVSGLTNVVSLSAGAIHSVALEADGTVWAWGGNANGQLGNGSNADSSTPVQVSGLTGVAIISSGATHNLAVKCDGTLWAWGSNAFGELGDGTTTARNAPIQITAVSGVIAIAAGNGYSLVVKSDGTVWGWGANAAGQLGNGSTSGSLVPVQVSGLMNAVTVAAGTSHSLAIESDGTVWAWGNNAYGELGDGTTVSKTTAVRVLNVNDCSFWVNTTYAGSYQWQRKPAGQSAFYNLTDDGTYSGTTSATLKVHNPTGTMNGDQFLCVVSNSYGSTVSASASLVYPQLETGKAVFTKSGQTSWQVPPGVNRIEVKAWGAGGVGGGSYYGYGGAGGYVTAMYSVVPGQIINVGVGALGGTINSPSASAAWVSGGFQLIAGGGGSGGAGNSTNGTGGNGGPGGPSGGDGAGAGSYATGGQGATSTSGGAGGTDSNGNPNNAGSGPKTLGANFGVLDDGGAWSYGSGGDGYCGGGAGGNDVIQGGGGGGSNYLDTAHGYISGYGSSLGGSGWVPPAVNDPDYPPTTKTVVSVGYGEYPVYPYGSSSGGAVVILYNQTPSPQMVSVTPASVSVQTGTPCVLKASGGISGGNWQWTAPANCLISSTTAAQTTVTPMAPGTYTVSVVKYGDINNATSNTATVTLVVNGPTVLSSPGAYSIQVPSGTSAINVRTWGAGGGAPNILSGSPYDGIGGGGGFASATYSVTAGQTVNIIVGAGSGSGSAGASAAYISNGFQIIAGAGGSGGYSWAGAGTGGNGGAGGPSAQAGQAAPSSAAMGGGGATTSGAGVGGAGDQSYYGGANGGGPVTLTSGAQPSLLCNGGPGSAAGKYGGGGYYGGGGGGYDDATSLGGGGGGGSNYVDTNPAHGYLANTAVSLGGNGATPANTTDIYYVSGAGLGKNTAPGGNGCVVIDWNGAGAANPTSSPDTSPPSAPPWLNYANAAATNITLTWGAAKDDVGVVAYLVYRGTQLLGSTPDLTFTDGNLSPSTAYSYSVKAQDAAGNLSAASPVLNVSTTQDFSADSDHDGIPDATESALGTNVNSPANADTSNQTQQNIHRPTQ